jgi:hypothetical protein
MDTINAKRWSVCDSGRPVRACLDRPTAVEVSAVIARRDTIYHYLAALTAAGGMSSPSILRPASGNPCAMIPQIEQ